MYNNESKMNPETKEMIKNVFVFSIPFVLIWGVVGNAFSFIIFSRKKFRVTFFSVYFRILAFTDTFTLLFIINDFPATYFNEDIQNSSYIMCKMFYYFIYSISPTSAWILVIVSLDRMLNIIRPNQYLFMKKKKTQIMICFAIFVFNIVYYIPQAIYKEYQEVNLSNSSTEIEYKCVGLDEEKIVDWMDLFNSTIMPFILMIIFTSITVKRLFESRSKTAVERNLLGHIGIKNRDVKFALTSISLNIFFFLFNLPVCIFHVLTHYIVLDDADFSLLNIIILFCFYLNFGIVFYVNVFTNPLFRNELLIFLRIKKVSDKFSNNNNFRKTTWF